MRTELAKVDYSEYCKIVNGEQWILGDHLKLVCEKVEDLIYRKCKENILIISMPPQHGKSQCVSETLPSYYIGKNPDSNIIELSYGDDLAQRFSRKNKAKLQEFGKDIFGIELDRASDGLITIQGHNGTLISKGIMAGVTGNPADLVIIDDPIKSKQEAESQTYRDRIWEEYLASVNTRLSANGVVIVIMTRWHEDDLVGRIKKNLPGKFIEINIPLEAEEGDILGREVGDALFPQIGKDNAWLKNFKEVYTSEEGSRTWNALMQGKPNAANGNMILDNWWREYTELPRCALYITTVDATFKDTSKSDFVAIEHWGKINNDYYLIDLINKRMGFLDTLKAIRIFNQKYPKTQGIYIEDKANGSAILDVLKKDRSIANAIAFNPGKDSKESRVSAITPIIESGNVYLPQFGSFTTEFKDQCRAFPNGTNDDMVDCMSIALNILRRRVARTKVKKEEQDPAWGRVFESDEEEIIDYMTGGKINKEIFDWRI